MVEHCFRTKFQSTPLMRGETAHRPPRWRRSRFQSTPLMRGETLASAQNPRLTAISIHSPHARGDYGAANAGNYGAAFQSTPLMRGETVPGAPAGGALDISIHSPHARGDTRYRKWSVCFPHFNPLPSCEGRLFQDFRIFFHNNFNPLPSCEGRRYFDVGAPFHDLISIHSPHARGDRSLGLILTNSRKFQSTPLMRGETPTCRPSGTRTTFQSTPLMRGETY